MKRSKKKTEAIGILKYFIIKNRMWFVEFEKNMAKV
jgi:hypothetical protein